MTDSMSIDRNKKKASAPLNGSKARVPPKNYTVRGLDQEKGRT